MRVLQVTQRYYPYMGGIETHVHEVARRMAARGVDVTVLSTDVGRSLPPRETVEGVRILRVPAHPRRGDLYLAPGVFREIMPGQWDVMHVQGYHTFVPPVAMLAALRARVPYVLTFHSGGHSSSLRHAGRSAQTRALRPLLARAARLIGVSRFEADLFRRRLRFPAERFEVVPNGAQLPVVGERPPQSPTPVVLSVGRLEEYKGHHRLIEAWPHVLRERPDAHLRILGRGTFEARLRRTVAERGLGDAVTITFVPPAERAGMADELLRASLVVLFSEYEAHPVAVMEAAALDCSILVADTSGLSEIAQQGLAQAIPIDSGPERIAEAVVRQLREPFRPGAFTLPTWEGCTDRLLEVYRGVLDRAA